MKLATLRDGSRDGQLAVVSRDLGSAHFASGIAGTLRQLLDDWNFISPQLEDLYLTLNLGKARHAFPFDPRGCAAPLPRAAQRLAGAACPAYVERLHQAAGREAPPALRQRPLLWRGAADAALGPGEALCLHAAADAQADVAAELLVATGDIAAGTDGDAALDGVRLLLLAGDWRLHALADAEAASGAGLVQGWPATHYAPLAVTPDELGGAWRGGRIHAPIEWRRDGRRAGRAEPAAGMHFGLGELLAQAARSAPLRAGSLVGSGPLSAGGDDPAGALSIAEQRALQAGAGAERAPWLQPGERVAIELFGPDGASVFGAVEAALALPV